MAGMGGAGKADLAVAAGGLQGDQHRPAQLEKRGLDLKLQRTFLAKRDSSSSAVSAAGMP